MDLLSSLGLSDALPEQSTRLTSHPGIVKALNDGGEYVRLGFNACLHCGSRLDDDEAKEESKKSVRCKACKRVRYCSKSCRRADSEEVVPPTSSRRHDGDDGEDEAARGHSPVVCALLSLCDDDDDAEEGMGNDNSNNGGVKNNKNKAMADDPKKEAALYRVRTELESYPATLFNVLSEGPDWFVEAMTRRVRRIDAEGHRAPTEKRRRGKRDRASPSPTKKSEQRRTELVLHVVGASADSELWGWDGTTDDDDAGDDAPPEALAAYAEASANLTSRLRDLLGTSISIRCVFVGPDCPESSSPFEAPVTDDGAKKSSTTMTFETRRRDYGDDDDAGRRGARLPDPDAVVFFNPGFSCPDYEWDGALAAAARGSPSLGPTPFLVTTNTEMEGFADVKRLLEGGHVDPRTLPRDVLEAVDHSTGGSDEEEDEDRKITFFFGENPYAGLRVRQSGTMGNDLYVKNRWIVGGLFRRGGGGGIGGTSSSKKRKKAEDGRTQSGDGGEAKMEEGGARKRHRAGGGGGKNSKKKNPALI